MQTQRPKLILHKSRTDKIMDILIVVIVLRTWLLAMTTYNNLPDTIPVHFDLHGNVDNYGSKSSIWFLPILSVLIILGLRFINKFPHNFNYLVKITPDNALVQYTAATRMIRYIQFMVALVFLFILYDIIHTVHSGSSMIGVWFIPLLFFVFLLPVAVNIFKSRKKLSS